MIKRTQHHALFYDKLEDRKVLCQLCPHHCRIRAGHSGLCGVRTNHHGTLIAESYGQITALALDPIEKKPLARFHPGSRILSVGSYGCNFSCDFCQNHTISMIRNQSDNEPYHIRSGTTYVSPEELVEKALELVPQGNIGIAYTYNEPFISYEYVCDCSRMANEKGLKNVLVSNGYVNKEPLTRLLPYIHGMNIDLKGYGEPFYSRVCGGSLEPVKNTIETAAKSCHVEITTLIIPDLNDSEDEMTEIATWLASINPEIPFHLSRFFPNYKMDDTPPTPIDKMNSLVQIAREHLKHVYTGNM